MKSWEFYHKLENDTLLKISLYIKRTFTINLKVKIHDK